MIDLEGLTLTAEEEHLIANEFVGGIILFTRNYEDRHQLGLLIRAIRDIKPNILIAVDQEGGRVQRFKHDYTRLPAMQCLGEIYQEDTERSLKVARELGWLLAAELLCEDIDISFAPVLDLDFGISSVIGDRSFAGNPESVIALAGALMQGMHEAGMACTAKHFPGHGGVAADSHIDIPVDERDIEEISLNDLAVFSALASQYDAVMPAHVIYPAIDQKPAGFSQKWLAILREQCGFKGVVFSDDLSMEGASVAGSFADRAEAALEAGCDMVLVCNHREGAKEVLRYFESQSPVENKRLPKMLLRSKPAKSFEELKQLERWHTAERLINSIQS